MFIILNMPNLCRIYYLLYDCAGFSVPTGTENYASWLDAERSDNLRCWTDPIRFSSRTVSFGGKIFELILMKFKDN